MSNRLELVRRFQRHPSVRLRRESWGGLAFHRDHGDLVELDAEGFDTVAALAKAQTLPDLRGLLRTKAIRRGGSNWRRSFAFWRTGASSVAWLTMHPTCPPILGARTRRPRPIRV